MPIFSSAFNGLITDVSTTAQNEVGSIVQLGGKRYKYVELKNTTATVAGAAGSLVGYTASSGATTGYPASQVCVDMSDADTTPIPAGITLAAVTGTLTVSYYCWIQITGAATLDTSVSSGAAGKEFILSTTDKTGSIRLDATVVRAAGISVNTTTGVILTCPD